MTEKDNREDSAVEDGSDDDWYLKKRPKKFCKLEEFLTRLRWVTSCRTEKNFKI